MKADASLLAAALRRATRLAFAVAALVGSFAMSAPAQNSVPDIMSSGSADRPPPVRVDVAPKPAPGVPTTAPAAGAAPAPAVSGLETPTTDRTKLAFTDDLALTGKEQRTSARFSDVVRFPDPNVMMNVIVRGTLHEETSGGRRRATIEWTSVERADGGKRLALPGPLKSAFSTNGTKVPKGQAVTAQGDVTGAVLAARSLYDANVQVPAPKNEKDQQSGLAAMGDRAPITSGGAGASQNPVLASYKPPEAKSSTADTSTPDPQVPTLTTTTNGCPVRVDEAAGYAVIQSQLLKDGAPSEPCSDTTDRIPLQKSYAGCTDDISGTTVHPQFRLFYVAPSGLTEYISDCKPDPDTTYQVQTDTASCTSGADLTTMQWVVRSQTVYTNRNNQKVVLSPCSPSSQTALTAQKDFSGCDPQVDKIKGMVTPTYKGYYVSPDTQQQVYYTSCQADVASAVAIREDYSGCSDAIDTSSGQAVRQYVSWYSDPNGKRVDLGACEQDINTSFKIQTTSAQCSDFIDQTKGRAFQQTRQFYFNQDGKEVQVTSCAPNEAVSFDIQKDYTTCPAAFSATGDFAQDQFELYYMDGSNNRQSVAPCARDPERLYAVKRDYSKCTDKLDIPNLVARAQFTTYYTDINAKNIPVNSQCQPEDPGFQMSEDVSACSYLVDTGAGTAQQQAQLVYQNRMNARVLVQDCRPTALPAVPVTLTPQGCSMRDDFTVHKTFQQKKYVYTRADGAVVDATPCADSDESYVQTAVYNVCPDLVLSDNSAAFRQIRWQISPPSGTRYITDCEPSTNSKDTAAVQATVQGCETVFYHYIDQGQSFGAQRFYYLLPGGAQAVYVTSCQQSTVSYTQQVEIQGYQYNDVNKTAQPKTGIYIMPPIGRVDVSPAQVRAGAPDISYTFVASTTQVAPNSKYWQGCTAYQPTNKVDTYKRPDDTLYSYMTGPGPTATVGDECQYLTQQQTVFHHSVVSGGANGYAVFSAGGGANFNGDTTFGAPISSVQVGIMYSSGTEYWYNYNALQQRTQITYPNNQGVTYTAWQTVSVSLAGQGTVAYQPYNSCPWC